MPKKRSAEELARHHLAEARKAMERAVYARNPLLARAMGLRNDLLALAGTPVHLKRAVEDAALALDALHKEWMDEELGELRDREARS